MPKTTTSGEVRVPAHLSRWLEDRGLSAADLTEERAGEYLAARQAAGYNWLCSPGAWHRCSASWPAEGLLPKGDLAPASAAGVLLGRCGRYLHDERALSASTACSYLKRAGRFLDRCAADGDVASLTADQVTGAVLAECAGVSAGSAQYFVCALRSFRRFCYLEELTGSDLSAAALGVTGRRPSWLPRGMNRAPAARSPAEGARPPQPVLRPRPSCRWPREGPGSQASPGPAPAALCLRHCYLPVGTARLAANGLPVPLRGSGAGPFSA